MTALVVLAFTCARIAIGKVGKEGRAMVPEFSASGVPQEQSKILASYFVDASERLKQIVVAPPGTTERSREYNAAWAASHVAQIDPILASLKQKTSGWVGKNMPQAFVDGRKLADKQAREVLKDAKGKPLPAGTGIAARLDVVDVRTANVFARDSFQRLAIDAYQDTAKAADSLGARATSVLRATAQQGLNESQINRILAGGVIDGKPVEAIRNLRDALRAVHGGEVEIIDKNGDPRSYDVRHYAELVARTKTRQATVTARNEHLEEMGLDLVAIVGKISSSFCTAFLGQVFSLSGKSSKYPAYATLPGGGPPFHPNCSKSTRPFIEALATDKQLDLAGGLEDSNKLLGMDTSEAQRSFKDLQLRSQVKEVYATTAAKLFS